MVSNIFFKWNFLLVFILICELRISEEISYIDDNCILYIKSLNKTNKFNLTRTANEIDSTQFADNTSILLRFCENSVCPGYSCLHYKGNRSVIYIGTHLTSAIFNEDMLKLVFTGIHKCNSSTNYSTNILLACRHENKDQEPQFDKYEGCNFSILWFSSVGCPLKEVSTVNSCLISTNTTSYDLRPLYRPTGYSELIGPKGTRIHFNICGYLQHSLCDPSNYLCEISSVDDKVLATSKEYVLKAIDEKVSITFKKSQGNGKIIINLVCKTGLTNPSFEFIQQNEKNEIYFAMYTTIVCKSPSVNCQIQDQDKDDDDEYSYDLTELQKLHKNWEVSDTKGNTIVFNVCGILNYEPGLACSGGNIFSCLKTSKNETFSLGTDQGQAVIQRRGRLIFNYLGGSVCKDNEVFSQIVSLVCSNKDLDPVLFKSSDCVYSVKWYARAACPVKFIKGKNCTVNDINLNNLFNKSQYRINTLENGSFSINLCQSVKCDGEDNVAICWTDKENKKYAIGYSSEPVFSDNRIKYLFIGKPCNKNETKSIVKFELKCDFYRRQTYPTFISQSENCVFNFIWYTNIICQNKAETECKVQDEYGSYDLTPLMLNTTNYEIKNKNDSIYLNICQSLVPTSGVRCRNIIAIGACYVNSKTFEDSSLGYVSEPLQIVNKTLQLSYTSGDVCEDGDKPSYSIIFRFYCDLRANSLLPIFLNYDNCVYNFEWRTPYACPIKSQRSVPTTNVISSTDIITVKTEIIIHQISCVVDYPHSKWRFDLTPLMEKDWIIDSTLTISICRPLHSTTCSPTSGSCLKNSQGKFINMGNANSDLRYEEGILYLNYTGENCTNTIIYFSCHEETRPIEVEDFDHCTTIIHWATPLACQSGVGNLCCEKEGGILCQLRDSYLINIGNATVFLNICKIPKPQPELSCSKTTECVGSKLFYSNVFVNKAKTSLNNIEKNKTDSLELQYIFGKICYGRISKMYSISLKLYCDYKLNQDSPRFLSMDGGCSYNFEWHSNLFCKNQSKEKSLNKCNIINKTEPEHVINKFKNVSSRTALSMSTGNSYYLTFCDTHSICKSDICVRKGTSLWDIYASIHHITLGRNPNVTVVHYSILQNNSAGFCGAEVSLICNLGAEEGEPIIKSESACNLEVVWESKYACSEERKTSNTANNIADIVAISLFTASVLIFTAAYLIWKNWHFIKFISCRRFSGYQEEVQTNIPLRDFMSEDIGNFSQICHSPSLTGV